MLRLTIISFLVLCVSLSAFAESAVDLLDINTGAPVNRLSLIHI